MYSKRKSTSKAALRRHSVSINRRLAYLLNNINKLKVELAMYDINKKLNILKL